MKLKIAYPVRPFFVNQPWGVFNAIYNQFGFSRHNGVDLALIDGQRISAPFDCEVIRVGTPENGLWQPNGGGIFVGILSKEMYDFEDGKQAKVLIDFLHCKKILVSEGQTLSVGDALADGDNTGFSTGHHTHVQFRRVIWSNKQIITVDQNDANNSFDPTPYWTGVYADSFLAVRLIAEQIKRLADIIKGRFGTR